VGLKDTLSTVTTAGDAKENETGDYDRPLVTPKANRHVGIEVDREVTGEEPKRDQSQPPVEIIFGNGPKLKKDEVKKAEEIN